MLMKDIKVGEEYAAVSWQKLDYVDLLQQYADREPDSQDWENTWRECLRELSQYARRVRVVEKGVQVSNYARLGVLVEHLHPETGEPDKDGPEPCRSVQIIMEWDRLHERYHAMLEAYEAHLAQREIEREQHKRERQEAGAREWMERTFNDAKDDLRDMVALGAIDSFDDDQVRALVAQRYPEGNPYLNGEREAY